MSLLVPVLGSALLVALGFMLHAMWKKQELSSENKELSRTQSDAMSRAEKADLRIEELERKLAKARNVSTESSTQKESMETSIQKLEDENRQLRLTIERTASRATPAQIENTDELHTVIDKLKGELSTLHDQLTAAAKDREHFEKKVADIRDTVEREAAGASAAYQQRVEQVVERFHAMKKRLIHAERELRVERRLADNNNRAYHITLQQLDLAQDQVYSLQTGSSPNQRKGRLLQSLGLEKATHPSDADADADEDIATAEEASIENDTPDTHDVTDAPADGCESSEDTPVPTDDEASLVPESPSEDTDAVAASANAV